MSLPQKHTSTNAEAHQQEAAQPDTNGRDPSLPENHPINKLSARRKFAILCVLSYSGFLANFSIAIIQVAFGVMGKSFGVAPPEIPKTIGYNLLGIAVGPLFWNPLSKTMGRRFVYLLGSALFIPCTIWMALSPTYLVFCISRVFAGITSSFSQTIPPATVADMYVPQVRGSKMSMFGVAVVVAPAIAPIFCGAIIGSSSWRNLFWLILGLSVVQLALFFFVVPETLWNDTTSSPATGRLGYQSDGNVESLEMEAKGSEQYIETTSSALRTGHVGRAWYPWERPGEYMRLSLSPIFMLRYLPITLTSVYYGSIFAWSVGITIVMPQKFDKPPYNFASIPLGAAFLAFGVGGVLGKWSGGIVGDKVVSRLVKKKGNRQPEFRLWALLPILPFMFVGCIIVGIVVKKELHWIAYLIGGGLFFFCLSAATGVLQTYVLESYIARSMDTQAVFVFWKSIWGFAIAFFVYDWGEEHGFLGEYAIQGALSAGVGALLCGGLIWRGYELRRAQGMPVEAK